MLVGTAEPSWVPLLARSARLCCCPAHVAAAPLSQSHLPPRVFLNADVHCYVLANVLRRPILIYSDETAAAAGLSGIYLPSLWPRPQEQCSRQPLSVLFGWSHFSLLLTIQGEGPASPPLLPLATRSGPLLPRFLSAAEQALLDQAASAGGSNGGGSGSNLNSSGGGNLNSSAGATAGIAGSSKAGSKGAGGCGKASSKDAELELLCRYMNAVRLYDGRLGVRLSGVCLPEQTPPAACLDAAGWLGGRGGATACRLQRYCLGPCLLDSPTQQLQPPHMCNSVRHSPSPAAACLWSCRSAAATRVGVIAWQRLRAAGAPGAAAG